ncbi:MAG: TonB-dependent receptor [Chitinophagales bacterium]
MQQFIMLFLLLLGNHVLNAQISGKVSFKNEALAFVSIVIKENNKGTSTDSNGFYEIKDLSKGNYTLVASMLGYETVEKKFELKTDNEYLTINFSLKEVLFDIDQIVVTGSKTFKRRTNSPVIVNVIDAKTLNDVQACNLSEGLKFQTGLRVETDCQTCNYTQLRMNGLGGGYSQILINGRPIFSPLTGLYGLEQIPANMIDKIEVVRGGGSALYGSSAIGGTVNVMTKIPDENQYSFSYTYQNINSKTSDHQLAGNGTVLTKNKKAGASIFLNYRDRQFYDHNQDNFSELPALKTGAFGTNMFFLPKENQKLEASFSYMNEYRNGGEMLKKAPHLALQSEERTHNVLVGNLDYQINFNQDKTSFIAYAAAQNTKRKHYTGIFPDEAADIDEHLENPPYGNSIVNTFNTGTQLNHKFNKFLKGSNVFTFGLEYVYDQVNDEIEAYDYLIDQTTHNFGAFVQSDWEIFPFLNLLSGLRIDKHNFVNKVIASPRFSLLYKLKKTTQFRLTWGTGFRAPQAFDSDLHIAFAGGGISRISLAENLEAERSQSLSASVNFDKATEKFIVGFTVEGFYTALNKAFYLEPLGLDNRGERFEKRNGSGAKVYGGSVEFRANYNKKIQIETGFTYQMSRFNDAVQIIDELAPRREFMRTPNLYGFGLLTLTPFKNFNTTINAVYTGKMQIAHFAGAPTQFVDEIISTEDFLELNFKTSYAFPLKNINSKVEIFGGIKNLLNAYQNNFDIGKNRDSNFIYGPNMPRILFIGLKLSSK